MSIRGLGVIGAARPRRFGLGSAVGFAVLCVLGTAIGVLSVDNGSYAVLVAVALLSLGLASIDLGIFPVVAVPATLVMARVGGFLSVSDVVLAGATVVAILLISSEEARAMQPLIWLAVAYQACLVPTVLLNPYAANVVEWVHEAVLVLGSLIVGWVVGRQGHARVALSMYVLGCCGIAIAALTVALQSLAKDGTFGPAFLPYMHKNFIGNSLAVALVIAYARPAWIGWTRRWSWAAIVLCVGGIAASQSRQAVIAAVVGVVIVNLRPRVHTGRRSTVIWFALVPSAIFVVNAVNAQLQSKNRFNSTNQRLQWFADSIDIWHQSPLFGVGLRWWYTDRFSVSFQPPNAEFEMLTSAGIVGLAGFLVLFLGATWMLTKMDPRYGTVALAVVLTRFTQGQFDLYWVAGGASLLWVIAGMAFGVQAREELDGYPDIPDRSPPAVLGQVPSR